MGIFIIFVIIFLTIFLIITIICCFIDNIQWHDTGITKKFTKQINQDNDRMVEL